ncbi:MAG: YihY/virulence factor BrkB family protein [Deferribacteres bacterium]|nr:YihY/virulence factor BrkB family protein [candidate division KSB1 bacterium]MCB9501060.1 YihY/virulence factor BrkB family protein [Deferribacteres bacterium]
MSKNSDTKTSLLQSLRETAILTLRKLLSLLGYYLKGVYDRAGSDHLFLFSSAVSFSLSLCLVPLVLVIFFVLGTFVPVDSIAGQIDYFIDTLLPYPDSAAFLKNLVIGRVMAVLQHKNVAGWLGGFGLLFAASGWFTSMRSSLNVIFHVEKTPNKVVGKMKDILLVLLILVFFALSFAILPSLQILLKFSHGIENVLGLQFGAFEAHFFNFITLITIFYICAGLLYFIPDKRIKKRAVFLAAFWATLFQKLVHQTFGFYLAHFSAWGDIYGAYMVFIVGAFWIYLSSMTMLLAAIIGQLYLERQSIQS